MNEFHVKMSAMTVIIITLPYFMNQNNAQESVVATSFPA